MLHKHSAAPPPPHQNHFYKGPVHSDSNSDSIISDSILKLDCLEFVLRPAGNSKVIFLHMFPTNMYIYSSLDFIRL